MLPIEYSLIIGILLANIIAVISVYLVFKLRIEINKLKEIFSENMSVMNEKLNEAKVQRDDLMQEIIRVQKLTKVAKQSSQTVPAIPVMPEKPHMPEVPKMPEAPKMPEKPKMPKMPPMPPMPSVFDIDE